MVVLGLDVHKDTHTAVAVDEVGRKIGERLVRATDAGHGQLLRWARREFEVRSDRRPGSGPGGAAPGDVEVRTAVEAALRSPDG